MATVSTAHHTQQQSGLNNGNHGNTNERNDGSASMFLEPSTDSLPESVQQQLAEIELQFREGDLTDKGYHKRRSLLLIPYLIPYHQPKDVDQNETIIEPDVEHLPPSVVKQLSKLQEELNNEEITEKGFTKRRTSILAPYMLREPSRSELPLGVQQEYCTLEKEFKEGDITEKGFKKKKLKLLRPYLIAVNPSTYSVPPPHRSSHPPPLNGVDDDEEEGEGLEEGGKLVMGIQSVLNDGNKLFKCGVCGEVFKQAHSFSGHCRIHRGERVKKHKCSICNASYTTRSHLKFHMYKHTGDFPYTCSHCGKGFAGKSQHKNHESRHTGDSPYPCPQCGAKFWKKDQHYLHVTHTCPHRDPHNTVQQQQQQQHNPTPLPDVVGQPPWTQQPAVQGDHNEVVKETGSDNSEVKQQSMDGVGGGVVSSGDIHMQDITTINMSTINQLRELPTTQQQQQPTSTDVYPRDMTTPVLSLNTPILTNQLSGTERDGPF